MIYEKLANIQSKLFVPKDNKNDFGKYNYRSCEDILKRVKPLCQEEGCVLILTNDLVEVGERNYVKAHAKLIDLETKEEVVSVADAREAVQKKGMDESQITGTASSYARKYALAGLFCIDNEKDADSNEYTKRTTQEDETHTKATPEQIKKLNEMAGEKTEKMLEFYNVKNVEDLTIEQASQAIKGFEKKGK